MNSVRFSRLVAFLVAALLSALLICGPAPAAESRPYWPSEREDELEALDQQLLEVQRQLFNARMTRDAVTVKRLTSLFNDVKEERVELLRALGQLQ